MASQANSNDMRTRFSRLLLLLVLSAWSGLAWSQDAKSQSQDHGCGDQPVSPGPTKRVPTGVILVKGAWSSASDSVTPLPECGSFANNIFHNEYFGIEYPLSGGWAEKFKGPPPSDTGRYVLAQIGPSDSSKGTNRGNILVTAQDLFFTPLPAANAIEVINYTKEHLQEDYKVEAPPSQTRIAGHSFASFSYWSPVSQLHWHVLATEIRCHVVQIVLTSRDAKLLDSLILEMKSMRLLSDANAPLCIKDYARPENIITRVDPVFTEQRANAVPIRIIIDRSGTVKHIHFLSAFPDQAKAITSALQRWKFKQYLQDGQPIEVETGVLFGRAATLQGK